MLEYPIYLQLLIIADRPWENLFVDVSFSPHLKVVLQEGVVAVRVVPALVVSFGGRKRIVSLPIVSFFPYRVVQYEKNN